MNEYLNNEKFIIDKVTDYFKSLNKEESLNYFRNMKKLSVKKSNNGFYLFPSKVYYNNLWVLVHELFHVSSYDRDDLIDGFCDKNENGIALTEGMTEYLTMKFFKEDKPTSFFLEVFVIEMLLCIDDFKRYYFKASREDFISLFVNKDNILELSNLLDTYYKFSRGNSYIRYEEIELLVCDILNLLLDILSENINDRDRFRKCMYKFINLLDKYGEDYSLFNRKVVDNYKLVLGRK